MLRYIYTLSLLGAETPRSSHTLPQSAVAPPFPPLRPPLPVGVLNVQPDDVVRDLMVVEARVHGVHVSLVPVVPAALVIPERGDRGA